MELIGILLIVILSCFDLFIEAMSLKTCWIQCIFTHWKQPPYLNKKSKKKKKKKKKSDIGFTELKSRHKQICISCWVLWGKYIFFFVFSSYQKTPHSLALGLLHASHAMQHLSDHSSSLYLSFTIAWRGSSSLNTHVLKLALPNKLE